MRREHHHRHEDPFVELLAAEYQGRVDCGLIEARTATLCSGPAGQDRLSSEHLARAEVAVLAAAGPRHARRGRP